MRQMAGTKKDTLYETLNSRQMAGAKKDTDITETETYTRFYYQMVHDMVSIQEGRNLPPLSIIDTVEEEAMYIHHMQ